MFFGPNDLLEFGINIFKGISFMSVGVLKKYLCLNYIGSLSIVSVKI